MLKGLTAKPFQRQLRESEMAAVSEVLASAQQLYRVLSQCCTCDCTDVHGAGLCLKKSYHNISLHEEVYFEALIFHKPQADCETGIPGATCGYVNILLTRHFFICSRKLNSLITIYQLAFC